MKKFQKTLESGQERRHPGKIFRDGWDHQAIEKELTRANKERDLPKFELDKIEFHPATTCNLSCPWCYGRDVVPPIEQRRELPARAIENVLTDIRLNMSGQNPLILYAGLYSEPLRNRSLQEMIVITGRERFRFGVYTNGILLQKTLAEELANAAKGNSDARPSYVTFNLTSSLTLMKKRLDILLDRIGILSESRRRQESPLLLNGSVLATGDFNPEHYEDFIRAARGAGLDNIRFSFPWNAQRNESNGHILTPERYREFSEEFTRLQEKYPDFVSIRFPPQKYFNHCFVGTLAASISSEGDVFPCPEVSSLLFKETHSYGNIHETPFHEIWQGRKHKEFFYRMNPSTVEKRCVCCDMDEEINQCCSGYWNLGREGR